MKNSTAKLLDLNSKRIQGLTKYLKTITDNIDSIQTIVTVIKTHDGDLIVSYENSGAEEFHEMNKKLLGC